MDVNFACQGIHLALGQTEVEITAETRDAAHAQKVVKAVKEHGYRANVAL